MTGAARRLDEVKTPVLIWIAACMIGKAAGIEASTGLAAGVELGLSGGYGAVWLVVGGALEGLSLGVCQWAALRRLGAAVRFQTFVTVTMTGAVAALLLLHLARAAWGEADAMVFVNLTIGGVAGAVVGAAQAIALAKLGVPSLRWVLGCAVGWAAAAAAAGLLLPVLAHFEGVGMAALAGAGAGVAGGLVLGVMTARAITERRAKA